MYWSGTQSSKNNFVSKSHNWFNEPWYWFWPTLRLSLSLISSPLLLYDAHPAPRYHHLQLHITLLPHAAVDGKVCIGTSTFPVFFLHLVINIASFFVIRSHSWPYTFGRFFYIYTTTFFQTEWRLDDLMIGWFDDLIHIRPHPTQP